jgi:hypothetical protein
MHILALQDVRHVLLARVSILAKLVGAKRKRIRPAYKAETHVAALRLARSRILRLQHALHDGELRLQDQLRERDGERQDVPIPVLRVLHDRLGEAVHALNPLRDVRVLWAVVCEYTVDLKPEKSVGRMRC